MDCKLNHAFNFTYKAELDNGISEYEFDHTYFGKYNEDPVLNWAEAMSYKWVDMKWLEKDMKENGDIYTFWLKVCFEKLKEYLNRKT